MFLCLFSFLSLIIYNKVYKRFCCFLPSGTQSFTLFGGKSTTKSANKKKKTVK